MGGSSPKSPSVMWKRVKVEMWQDAKGKLYTDADKANAELELRIGLFLSTHDGPLSESRHDVERWLLDNADDLRKVFAEPPKEQSSGA